jgi:hypothetical protein
MNLDWWRRLRETMKIDVFDMNYLFLPQNLPLMESLQAGLPRKGMGTRLAAFCARLVRALLQTRLRRGEISKGKIWFFAVSGNQERALRLVQEQIAGSIFCGINGHGDQQLPLLGAYLWSLPFFPLVIWHYLKADQAQQAAFPYVADMIWFAYGYTLYCRRLLRRGRPIAVVMANDHLVWTRALLHAAKAEGVRTVYLQHASVTEIFPPLAFDVALLEGEDAAETYRLRGPSTTQIHLVGIPRLDPHTADVNQRDNVAVVGVCVGARDRVEQFNRLAYGLSAALPGLSFILRPHPTDPRLHAWEEAAARLQWGFSRGAVEDAFQYLKRVDLIIAGESNILLEAALLNVYPVYFDFSGEHLDWYRFHQHGLVERYTDPAAVAQLIAEMRESGRPGVRERAHRWCATVGTEWDGRSTQLAVEIIQRIGDEENDKS